ncbi:hypothetical protein [Paludifilum halophilum]|uniref:Antitoxin of toxin-antitoxin, RelE / RelB, TA system n=1 Tax=Paludifilum halophilum TaxID=1642702 RepID=A0A235B4A9_9BACL|nr:hypothetical protein [Paludifilum halophilum]OYD07124.1 hypothetical protein CHM34_12055 [Paludifilum halophilum]
MIMQIVNATDVRREWGRFIDDVVRERPKAIQRNRDRILALSMAHAQELLKDIRFRLEYEQEPDGSVSGSLEGFDLVDHAPTVEALRESLADQLIEYAERYLEEFNLYFNAPNRRTHFPYVLRVQLAENKDEVTGLIEYADPA